MATRSQRFTWLTWRLSKATEHAGSKIRGTSASAFQSQLEIRLASEIQARLLSLTTASGGVVSHRDRRC